MFSCVIYWLVLLFHVVGLLFWVVVFVVLLIGRLTFCWWLLVYTFFWVVVFGYECC